MDYTGGVCRQEGQGLSPTGRVRRGMASRFASRFRDFPTFITLVFSTGIFLLLSAGAAGGAPASPSRTVKSVGVVQNNAATTVSIRGDGALEYEYFLIEGTNLVIDIYNAANSAWPTVRKIGGPFLKQLRIGEHFQPRQMVRVQLELQKAGDFRVRDEGAQIIVSLGKPAAPPAPPPKKPPEYNTILGLTFVPMADRSRVEIKTASKPKYEVVESDNPLQVIVDIENAVMSQRAETTIDISGLERELDRVNTIQDRKNNKPYVRFVAHLSRAAPSRVTPGGEGITIDIDRLSRPSPSLKAVSAAAEVPAPKPGVEIEPAHPGKKISLDFVDADVNDMLRIIAHVAGVNFAAGDEVKGKVSIRLIDVPWEVALDTILMTNNPKLSQVPISKNIIRITTKTALLSEEVEQQKARDLERKKLEAERKMEEAAKELEPLVTREFSISYADIKDLKSVVDNLTSKRVDMDGYSTSDPRTNTIIVKDLRANVEEIGRIIRKLDTPTPAVVVEARIVEVTSDFSKELGVQWNVDFKADPSHGNALPVTFPNSIGLAGEIGDPASGENYMVSLPASAPTAGIGLSFGHIANTLSLDLRLQAAQGMGKTKILSTPRILVVQNEEAKMNVGQELPIPSTDVEGNREVEWREVGISLQVTPQVTNDKRVFMDIKVAKESQGPPVATTDGIMFSIISRKAETQVLIGDGETAVIGGLAIEGVQEQEDSVPALSKIPGLGWLFRHSGENRQRDELMIFLTPKIVASN
jgi:type IV pilus assembly protein PilQ